MDLKVGDRVKILSGSGLPDPDDVFGWKGIWMNM